MASVTESGRGLQIDSTRQDALGSVAEGLATALQCHEDVMGERLASLLKEQSALLARLEAARQVRDTRI